MRDARPQERDDRSGFSLIELLVVVGIIAVMAGIALPAIGNYIRVYKIRGAQSQVGGELQSARNKAISKNVNRGVDFIVQDATTYWVHIEDDQSNVHDPARKTVNLSSLTAGGPSDLQSRKYTLPLGVQFAANQTQCPDLGAAPSLSWIQYERLGNLCTASPCDTSPGSPAPSTSYISINPSDLNRVVCLYQPSTGLRRAILIAPGGRLNLKQ